MLRTMGFIPEKEVDAPLPLHELYEDQFPVTRELTYLNHAAVAPLCRPAAEAMKWLADDALNYGSLHYDTWMSAYDGLRNAAAQLINAHPDEIAIVKNTSEGIATIASGLKWKAGDRVVAFREEFPANYFPWLRLENRGVEVTWLSIYDPLETMEAALRGAKLLAVSHVNYLSGHRVDLDAIGALCDRHGCFFFVDAIQGMGAFPIDVKKARIDALAADGHKWMLGPEGNGVLFVKKGRLDEIEPVEFGWTNVAQYADYASRDMTLRADAGRFECGTLNTIGCFGQRAALEFLLKVGVDRIASAVQGLAGRLYEGVTAKGYEVLAERTEATGSGIVSFRHPRTDARTIVSDLRRNRVVVAPRQGWVRMSPHFYVDAAAIDRVVDLLPPA
jgi:selenocysteine lyase/cysteine desulfurase